jgi:hypothetical protein
MSLDLHELPPERRASVALDAITTARSQWSREHRRPKALSKGEALAALLFEAGFIWTVAGNLRNGVTLTDTDFERLTLSCRWLDIICGEAL